MATFGGKLSLTDSLLLPAPAPGGALSIHRIKTQSPSSYLWYNDPFQDSSMARCAGHIGRRRLERIRSVFRKGRIPQITETGKEVFAHRRGHANGNTEEKSDY